MNGYLQLIVDTFGPSELVDIKKAAQRLLRAVFKGELGGMRTSQNSPGNALRLQFAGPDTPVPGSWYSATFCLTAAVC